MSVNVTSSCSAFLLCLPVLLAYYVYLRLCARAGLPRDLPWASARDASCLSRVRSTLMSVLSTRELIQDGYSKFSKNNKPYVLPNILTGPEVIIPHSQLQWLLDQPENICSQNEVNREFLQADHTMLHPRVVTDTVHGDVIRKELTKNLGDYTNAIIEELDHAMAHAWGTDPVWKEVPAYDTMAEVITKLSGRVLVGKQLCRNEVYLENSGRYARRVVIVAAILNMIPKLVRPFLAPLVTWYDRRFYLKCAELTLPIIHERLSIPPSKVDGCTENDYIQWSIQHAINNDRPHERTPEIISKRLAVISFAAIQSSAVSITNALFDLASSPASSIFQTEMHDEVVDVLASELDSWTKSALAKMTKIDSALRESMRLGGFVSRGVSKKVMVPGGVTLPDGTHVPKGVRIGVSAYSIHHDEDVYPGAHIFDALRFAGSGCRLTLESEKLAGGARKCIPLVRPSESFMAFSYGKHACPGRFFAAQQLKLTLAYISLNYEIKPLATRPENKWFVGSIGPPMCEKICIRRRPGTTS